MSKQQTAIDWLRQEWLKRDMDISLKELFNKAKEMEKEQVIFSYNQGYRDAEYDSLDIPLSIGDISEFNNAKEYYNETYGEQYNTHL